MLIEVKIYEKESIYEEMVLFSKSLYCNAHPVEPASVCWVLEN
jgi:hypothetical protein